MTQPLAGVFAVLPTPFDDGGRLDLQSLASLIAANRRAGVAGFVVLGVMGEAAELSEDERREVVAAVKSSSDTLPVVIGVSGDSARDVASRAKDAGELGATAVMVSPARSLGISAAVAAASGAGLPVVIQDYPAGSGVPIAVDEIVAATNGPALVSAVKVEAPPTATKIAAIRERARGLPCFGGLGALFLIDELRAGASGTMTGFAMPENLVEIVREFARAPSDAERAWQQLLPLMRFEAFPPLSLAARKEVWRLRGVIRSAYCRREGAVLDAHTREDVRRAFGSIVAIQRV